MNKRLTIFLIIFALTGAFVSCDSDESASGTISLSITDAPLDNPDIVAVNLAIIRVDVKGPGGREVLDTFEDPVDVNLLEYREGNSFLLTEETLLAGEYSEIRLVLDIAEHDGGDAANRGTYLEYSDGSTEPLFVPSGAQSGYKAKGSFTIPAGGVVGLTIDFDARRAVVEAGSSGKMLLKPVVRLVEDDDVAMIEGSVSASAEYGNLKVFAYENDTFSDSELIPVEESVEFPNALTSATVNEDGTFTLAFMESGVYDLVIATYDDSNAFQSVVTIIEDVELEPGQILELPVELP